MVNYIVSGCPRSGTSLAMRMLSSAGMPIAKDDRRVADVNNQHGYFEVDSIINKIKENPSMLGQYKGKVLKVIHYGLRFFPKGDYKIIYIERDIEEVLDSMEKMIGKPDPNREGTKRQFLALAEEIKSYIKERDDVDVLFINHADLLSDPEPTANRIIEFCGLSTDKKQAMLDAIDHSAYRNRRLKNAG